MSCCCPYCMSELDINKIKYYVDVYIMYLVSFWKIY